MSKTDNLVSTVTEIQMEKSDDENTRMMITEGIFTGVEYDLRVPPNDETDKSSIGFEYGIINIETFEECCKEIFERVIIADIEARIRGTIDEISAPQKTEAPE